MMHNNFSDKVMPQESSALDSSFGVSQVVHDMIDEGRSASFKTMPRKPDIVDDNGQLSFTNIFNAFDRNKDGNINQAEFASFFGLDKPPVHDRPVAPPPGKHPGGPPDVVIDPIERPPVHDRPVAPPPGKHPGGPPDVVLDPIERPPFGRDPGCDLPPLPRPSHPPDVVIDPIERPPFGRDPGCDLPPLPRPSHPPDVVLDPIERPPFGKEPGDIIPPGSLDGIERPPIGKWPGRPPVSIDPIERPNSYTFRRNAL
ncbi:MAG: hypothetical protein K2Y32_08880 [Candidatus Obscuribacterales bacterium]|nr:hypothetical protein [Candidatus Obscuribacterales bacterium]